MRTSAKNAILVTLSVSNYCGVDVRMSVRNFFDYYKCPAPQPNIEIRKPNIELKVTLISVTICSLIFFICTSCFVSSQVAISIWIKPCGVPKYGKSENYSDMSILSKFEPNSKFEWFDHCAGHGRPIGRNCIDGFRSYIAYDHTTMNTPVLVWSRKLSIVGPG